MTELDKYVKDYEFMFEERDLRKAQEAYNKALEESLNQEKREVKKTKREVVNKKTVALVLSALLALGVVSLNVNKNDNDIKDDGLIDSISNYFTTNATDSKYNIDNMSKLIGELVFEEPEDFNPRFDRKDVSILTQSTRRINEDLIVYDHDKIARLLLNAERMAQEQGFSVIEYATCAVFNQMGKYADVKPLRDNQTNKDLVIKAIRDLDKDKIAKEFVGKAKNSEELIEGLGYKDFASWKEAVTELENSEILYEHLIALLEIQESKGAKL